MAYDGMDSAMTNQANKQAGVLRRFGSTGAIIVAACLGAGATFLGYGVDANLPWPVTSNTTIAAKYCGGTVLAGTGSTGQFTLTLPAVTGFPSNCSVLIKNGDSTNGKSLSGFPSDLNSILYPQQSVGVKIVSGSWQTFYNPGPWLVPAGVQIYASPSGSDLNDGLTPTTPVTLSGACSLRSKVATFRGAVGLSLADGTYSTAVGGALCTVNGNSGGSSSQLLSITGDCGTPTNVVLAVPNNNIGILVQDGGEAGINCLEFTGGNNSQGIQSRQYAVADYGNVYWGSWGTGGAHLSVSQMASSNQTGPETILANFNVHWNLSNAIFAGASTSISSSVTFTAGAFLVALGNSFVDLSSWSLSGAGVSGATGQRAALQGPGFLLTPGMGPNGGRIIGQSDFLFNAIVEIRNVTLSNESGTCLNVQQQAYVMLDDLITFGTCTGSQINVGLYGQVEFFNDFTISGSGGFFVTKQEEYSTRATASRPPCQITSRTRTAS